MANLFNECFRVFDPQIGILFFESCSFSIVLLLYGTVALLILLLLLSSCCCYCIMLLQKYCVAILQRWQRRDSMWEFSTLSALTIESPLLASQHHLSVSFQICDDRRDLPTNPFMFLIAIQSPIRNSIPTWNATLHVWHWCLLLIETPKNSFHIPTIPTNHSPNVWWPWQHLLLHERFSFNSPVAQNDNNGDQTRLPSGSFPSISGQHFSDHYLSSPAGICRCPNLLWHRLLPHPDPAAGALLTVVINVRPPPNTLDHSQESPRPTSDRAVT